MSTAASPSPSEPPRLLVLMGVCGCGKSSVGAELARRLGAPFLDGDDLHPEANVAKMARGEPLDDADRWPWLAVVGRAMAGASQGPVVAACSALRRAYREALTQAAGEPVLFVHLEGPRPLIEARMRTRAGHYMPLSLLDSQLATLEPPAADERAWRVEIDRPVAAIVEEIEARLTARPGGRPAA